MVVRNKKLYVGGAETNKQRAVVKALSNDTQVKSISVNNLGAIMIKSLMLIDSQLTFLESVWELNSCSPILMALHCPILALNFKGTVSPDIVLHFSFWKIKLVLYAGPLMVLTIFYFVVPEILKN